MIDPTCLPDVQWFSFCCSLGIKSPHGEKEQRYPPNKRERWLYHKHSTARQPHGPPACSSQCSREENPSLAKTVENSSVFSPLSTTIVGPSGINPEQTKLSRPAFSPFSLLSLSWHLNGKKWAQASTKQGTMDRQAKPAAAACRLDATPPSFCVSLSHTQTHAHLLISPSLVSHALWKGLSEAVRWIDVDGGNVWFLQ